MNKRLDDAIRSGELVPIGIQGDGAFGVRVAVSMKPLPGVRFECFAVCTEFVPNKRIVETWSLNYYGTYTYTFDAEVSGTRVTLQRHPRSLWRLRLLDRLMDQMENRSNEKFLGRVKLFLKTSAPAAAR